MENRNNQAINRKVKEIIKEYQNNGYKVIENPSKKDIPNFLKDFIPDIIASKKNDNVIIEVKVSTQMPKVEFLELERIASIIDNQKNWRFDLVFTNPKDFEESRGEELVNDLELNARIQTSINLKNNDINSAFLILWSIFESVSRKLTASEFFKNKSISAIIKNLYGRGVINQTEYKNIDDYLKIRNNISHGFIAHVDEIQFDELLEMILKMLGTSKFSFIYNWINNLDLDNYLEVYNLYSSVEVEGDYGIIKSVINETSITLEYLGDSKLTINNTNEKKAMLEYLSEEYMNGLDPETYYSLNYYMEKED